MSATVRCERPWCTREHKAGANPRRQHHIMVWQASRQSPRTRVELYPAGFMDPPSPRASVSVRIYGINSQYVWLWMDARDALEMGQAICEAATHAIEGRGA